MIRFLDLQALNARHRDELIAAFTRVLDSGWYVLGDEVTRFEGAFADYCGTRFCIGVGNGLDALTLSLRAWKELGRLHEGDEVIVPANTYIASILAITENRLQPVLVEPEEQSFNLDPALIEAAITPRTRAILSCICTASWLRWTPFVVSQTGTACCCWKTARRRTEPLRVKGRQGVGVTLPVSRFSLARTSEHWVMPGR